MAKRIKRPDEFKGRNQDRQEFKVVGRQDIRIPGAASYAIATGTAKYSRDVVRPDMIHGKILRSPYAHARIKNMDTSKAEALPGVRAVITWEDEGLKAMPLLRDIHLSPGFTGTFDTTGIHVLDNEAEREGDEVGVCVAAESEEICDQALKLIEIEWEILPHVVDPMDALKSDAPILHPELSPYTNCIGEWSWEDGNVEAGFREADRIMEYDRFYTFTNNHKPNPYTVVAWWEEDPLSGEGETLYIEGSGAPFVKRQLMEIFKLPENRIHWLTLFDGGQYCDMTPRRLSVLAPLLARRARKPVRIAYTRRDNFDAGGGGRAYHHIKIGFNNDGMLTAAHSQVVLDCCTLQLVDGGKLHDSTKGLKSPNAGGSIEDLRTTRCLNIKSEGKLVYTNTTRSVASPWADPWEVTNVIWRIADALGMDPTEVALKNCHTPEPSLKLCIEKGKAAINWDEKWHPPGTRRLSNGRMHGLGFKYHETSRHSHAVYTCFLNIKSDGKVYVPYRGPIRGVYCEDACALVIAEELGAKPSDVIIQFDPDAPATCLGGGADGGAGSTWVAKEAAIELKAALLRNAAVKLGVTPEELNTSNSLVYFKANPKKNYNFGVFATDTVFGWPRDLAVAYTGKPPRSVFSSFPTAGPESRWTNERYRILNTMNAVFCEVEVDTETGELEITRWVAAQDVGKAIRPSSVEGQIENQFIFNTGNAKSEEFIWDKSTGVLLNGSTLEYKPPTILDIPPIDPIIVETRLDNGCYNATGVYHTIMDQAIVTCAVQNAIGKWVYGVPITPDKILRALGKI